RFGPAQIADDINAPAPPRENLVDRYVASVDNNGAAIVEVRRLKREIAGRFDVVAQRRASHVDPNSAPLLKLGVKLRAAKFRIIGVEPPPFERRWECDRCRGQALVHGGNQFLLPDLALELPGSESDQHQERGKRHETGYQKPVP